MSYNVQGYLEKHHAAFAVMYKDMRCRLRRFVAVMNLEFDQASQVWLLRLKPLWGEVIPDTRVI